MTRPKARPTLPSATGWTRRSRGEGGRVSGFSSGGVRGAEGGKGRAGGVRGFYRRARGGRRAIVRRPPSPRTRRAPRGGRSDSARGRTMAMRLWRPERARERPRRRARASAPGAVPSRAAARVAKPRGVLLSQTTSSERISRSAVIRRIFSSGSPGVAVLKNYTNRNDSLNKLQTPQTGRGCSGCRSNFPRAFSISRFPNLARFPVSSPVSSPPRLVPRYPPSPSRPLPSSALALLSTSASPTRFPHSTTRGTPFTHGSFRSTECHPI